MCLSLGSSLGFVYEGNLINFADDQGPAKAIRVPSIVSQINDTAITAENFADVYMNTEAPMTLHLHATTGTGIGGDGSTDPLTLTTEDLGRLVLVYFAVLIDWVGAAIVIPMLPFLAKEFNADEAMLGTMMAAFQA